MLHFILLKIKNKYKLYMCLLFGLIAMEASSVLIFMFRTGSMNKLIQKSFVAEYEETGRYPAVLSRVSGVEIRHTDDELSDIAEQMAAYESSWQRYLDIPVIAGECLIYIKGASADFAIRGKSGYMDIGYMDALNEHCALKDGVYCGRDITAYLPEGYAIPEQAYPCYISEHVADSYDLVVGETLTFNNVTLLEDTMRETALQFYISGIISENPSDYYWNKSLMENGFMLYTDEDSMRSVLEEYQVEQLFYEIYDMLDYRYIHIGNMKRIQSILTQFHERDGQLGENLTPVFSAYEHESRSLASILYVIALPLILLVLLFIGMLAFRIVDSEMGEIAGLASRGIGRRKIFLLYLLQELVLSGVAFLPGLLIGYGMGKAAAGVDDFLGFHLMKKMVSSKDYTFTWQMLPAGFIALVIAGVVMMVPVVIRSGGTLVDHRKRRHTTSDTPGWEKYGLDAWMLILSLYLLYNYNQQMEALSEAVIHGDGIDPMIFMDAMLFLVAAGLIILRLTFYGVRLFYKLFGTRLSPAYYAGVLQVLRTRKRSGIVSVFMVITVALSLFNANMARTINANQEERLTLDLGADYIIQEHFELKIKGKEPPQTWKYVEPDPGLYGALLGENDIEGYTRVIRDADIEVRAGGRSIKRAQLMGIHTREFGQTANMKENYGDTHWYNALNAMAALSNGCVISKNMAEELELKVGDTFTYSRRAPVDSVGIYASVSGRVAAIVEVWPGYEQYRYTYNGEGELVREEQFLIVANYAAVVNAFGITPYEIWMKGRVSPEQLEPVIRKVLDDNGRALVSFESNERRLREMKGSALIQITNGLFTADFLVAVILCVLGFMIHWISSIRDRELLFGIYRAMGISMGEIEKMLLLEQTFLTLISIVAGVVSGGAATVLFGRLFAVVYLPKKHSLPLQNVTATADMVRLGVVLLTAVVICMAIVRRIVKGLNVAEALKLSED